MEAFDLTKYRAARLVQQSEEGVADMFINMFAEDVRYETSRGWLLWTGAHWQQDKDDTVFRHVRNVTAQLDAYVGQMPRETKEQEKAADAVVAPVTAETTTAIGASTTTAARAPMLVVFSEPVCAKSHRPRSVL